ncbi:hypothetical protein HMPREF9123_0306 [Neisseria bacilliformis ATCC BAA-1200]|uniref:Uncharacterized protein n=1 Tax=Neisseria bacilliformis ATCC BAA-1200 TaxID=888742 RepID=F2B9A3_9NEIS|nr:hypothetical protein HMPREF9123_0306 [Neisseria bacilliformis ATCC BAA-1200]
MAALSDGLSDEICARACHVHAFFCYPCAVLRKAEFNIRLLRFAPAIII